MSIRTKITKQQTGFEDDNLKIKEFEYRIIEKKYSDGRIDFTPQYKQINSLNSFSMDFEIWSEILYDGNSIVGAKRAIKKHMNEQVIEVSVIPVSKDILKRIQKIDKIIK